MNSITTPIKTDNKEAVTNLQAALVFLLSKQSLILTADELNGLQKQWQQEQQEASYGEATTKLVAVFQKQYGISDNADKETAAKLNEVLKGLGAFDEAVKSPLEKKLEFSVAAGFLPHNFQNHRRRALPCVYMLLNYKF